MNIEPEDLPNEKVNQSTNENENESDSESVNESGKGQSEDQNVEFQPLKIDDPSNWDKIDQNFRNLFYCCKRCYEER